MTHLKIQKFNKRVALASAASFAALGGLGWLALAGKTHALDTALLIAIKNSNDLDAVNGPSRLTEFMRDITSLGGAGILTIITVTFSIFFLLRNRKAQAVYLSLAVITGSMFSNELKHYFGLPRPHIIVHETVVHSASFPSGHALTATVTFLTLALILSEAQPKSVKAYIVLVATLLSLLIGVSRLYLGVHWPSDVLAGWIAGFAWASLVWIIKTSILNRRPNS